MVRIFDIHLFMGVLEPTCPLLSSSFFLLATRIMGVPLPLWLSAIIVRAAVLRGELLSFRSRRVSVGTLHDFAYRSNTLSHLVNKSCPVHLPASSKLTLLPCFLCLESEPHLEHCNGLFAGLPHSKDFYLILHTMGEIHFSPAQRHGHQGLEITTLKERNHTMLLLGGAETAISYF